MKRHLVIAVTLLTAMFAVNAAHCLRVNHVNGDVVHFVLDEQPEVSFTGSKLKVHSTTNPAGTHFEMDEIDSIDFVETDALESLAANGGIVVDADASGIHFKGVPANASVAVFTTSGQTVALTRASGEFHLLRSDLPKGIYIVKINEFTLKTVL